MLPPNRHDSHTSRGTITLLRSQTRRSISPCTSSRGGRCSTVRRGKGTSCRMTHSQSSTSDRSFALRRRSLTSLALIVLVSVHASASLNLNRDRQSNRVGPGALISALALISLSAPRLFTGRPFRRSCAAGKRNLSSCDSSRARAVTSDLDSLISSIIIVIIVISAESLGKNGRVVDGNRGERAETPR